MADGKTRQRGRWVGRPYGSRRGCRGDPTSSQRHSIWRKSTGNIWRWLAMAGRPGAGRMMRRMGKCDAVDGDSDWPGRATRSGQNLIMEEDGGLPDKAAIEMGGSPVRRAGGDVGATQQGLKGIPSGEEHWEYMAMDGNGGSPWRGQDDATDGEMRCRGWGFGLAGEGDPIGAEFDHGRGGGLPDKAAIEMGGSPVHKREKGDTPICWRGKHCIINPCPHLKNLPARILMPSSPPADGWCRTAPR